MRTNTLSNAASYKGHLISNVMNIFLVEYQQIFG